MKLLIKICFVVLTITLLYVLIFGTFYINSPPTLTEIFIYAISYLVLSSMLYTANLIVSEDEQK